MVVKTTGNKPDVNNKAGTKSSAIDQANHKDDLHEDPHSTTVRVSKIQTIYGVVGIIKLLEGSYLVVITERKCVGSYLGHPIYKVLSLKVFSCDRSAKKSRYEKIKIVLEFRSLLKVAEKTHKLYFSYDVNITLSTQWLNDLGEEITQLPLYGRQSLGSYGIIICWNFSLRESYYCMSLEHRKGEEIMKTDLVFASAATLMAD
ncbi:phosphoinositide phosphatase SAC7-like protein [Tanacetum coccineum]